MEVMKEHPPKETIYCCFASEYFRCWATKKMIEARLRRPTWETDNGSFQ
jgi:hypothetical protein